MEDVKWSWERFIALSPSRGEVANTVSPDAAVESMTFPDASTAVVKLAFPYGVITKLLAATYYYYVVPVEAEYKFDIKQEMRGSGPWMMSEHEPSVGWQYRRNPNFYQAERPFLDGIDYPLIAESAQTVSQFRAGRIWNYQPPADLLVGIKRENPDVLMMVTSPLVGNGSGMILGMSRLATSPFADVRVRQAASMLIDRDTWIDTFFNVSALQREGLPIETGWHSHVYCSWPTLWLDPKAGKLGEAAKNFQYNPQEAARLLNAAGKFGVEQDFAYHSERGVFGGDDYQKQMEVFSQMLQQGGHFKLKTVTGPYVTFIRPNYVWNHGQYEGMTGFPHGARAEWDLMMQSNYYPSGKTDMVGTPLPKIHDIMLKYRRELDEKKRVMLAQDWQKEMAVYMPSIPFPGLASTFQLYWPWVGNAGVYQTWSAPAASAETLTQLWYDKAKDSRSS
jgi:ABC-type transport system substrate-binding protein